MLDKIKKFVNSDDVLILYNWSIINKNLINYKRYKLSCPINIHSGEILNMNVNAEIITAIRGEINRFIYSDISKKLLDTNFFDYLDIRPNLTSSMCRDLIEQMVYKIVSSGYKNGISTAPLMSEIQDSSRFNFTQFNFTTTTSCALPYGFGCLNNVDMYVDPYMGYNENIICLFDNVELNIDNFNVYEVANSVGSIMPRLIIEFDYDSNVGDSKLLLILDANETLAFKKYRELLRDIKLTDLLGEQPAK